MGEEAMKVCRAGDPPNPNRHRRGEVAEAKPAVPGWKTAVDDLFPPGQD